MNNKKVLEHCPNFYNINNFTFFDDDYISGRLIEIYRKFIFETDVNNEEDLKTLEKIDYVLNKYIEDYMFRKQLQKDVLNIREQIENGENIKTIYKQYSDRITFSGFQGIYLGRNWKHLGKP